MRSPSGFSKYIYSKTKTGVKAIYSSKNQISGEVVKTQKTFEGKDRGEIGIEHFGILARNPVVRLNDCNFFLDEETGEILSKKIFDRMDRKLHIKYLEFFETPLNVIRRVLSHVQPGFLEKISINGFDYAEGEEAEKEAKAVADMSQWKLAKQLWADGYDGYFSLFPVDDFLHAEKFFIELEEITVVDLVRVKAKLFLSPNFKEAVIQHYNDLTIEEFTAGLGSPLVKELDSPDCISFHIPGTEEYLDFKFKEHEIIINKRS